MFRITAWNRTVYVTKYADTIREAIAEFTDSTYLYEKDIKLIEVRY